MALIVLDYKFEQCIEFFCCLIPLLPGDYLWENKMMGNCIEIAEEFVEGGQSYFFGEEGSRAIFEMSHVLIH